MARDPNSVGTMTMWERETLEAGPATPAAGVPRGRRKWVTHGLSNRVVYGGLHYGARWLPLTVLHGISLFGNSLAVIFMHETLAGIRENYRLALGVPERKARGLARRVFFEYGRSVIDVWRLRSEAFVPKITSFDADGAMLAKVRKNGRGFLLVTGHVGNWEMGAVTLRGHALTPAVVGQPELDPDVEAMRLSLRTRLGVESIDIGSSMATAFRVRTAVEAGRAVALLVDRAYPEDQVVVSYFGRPTPFLRSPALLARFCKCEILPGFFLRSADGSYFNVWGAPIAADESLSPEADARRIMSRVAADLEAVVRAHPTQWFNFYRFWKDGSDSEDAAAARPESAGRVHAP
ncbi:MAG TPA: lysophospholipid acyltransferase family protein [Thermoanaerobaculia bacterium]|nr:lysophospholipid acyltransferase family protein [Thermoanaerobaculia bacterium]